MKSKLNRLKLKEFRDAYIRSHLSQGLAFQISALRKQRGWSQAELAKKLGVSSQSTVARMEDPSYGKLSIATLLKLSSIFDVALSVKFEGYGKYLAERIDLSPSALAAESFDVELPKLLDAIDLETSYEKLSNGNFSEIENYIHLAGSESADSIIKKKSFYSFGG